jgi:4-hydroxy-tetrahydrodipicolinate reductase
MKISIIGYGKMGREVEKIATERGHTVIHKLNKNEFQNISNEELKICDLAIEFTSPDSAIKNFERCFSLGIPLVTGTTGWYDSFEEIIAKCNNQNSSFFYASNFSIGVNIFFKLNEELARIMNLHPEYTVSMEEAHHIHKKDAPSGTAISIAEGIIKNIEEIKSYSIERIKEKNILPINVIREGEIPGTHAVKYRSSADEILIQHQAFNRKGFALGAVLAAEFLNGKKGVFSMDDLISFK